jgi:hypothetical protein
MTSNASTASKGLFSLVTGSSGGGSGLSSGLGSGVGGGQTMKRSFSSIFQNKKLPSNKAQKTSHYSGSVGGHFVFMEASNHGMSMSGAPTKSMMSGSNNNTLIDANTSASIPPLIRQKSTSSSTSSSSNGGGSSLFDKLASKTGVLKRSHTVSFQK